MKYEELQEGEIYTLTRKHDKYILQAGSGDNIQDEEGFYKNGYFGAIKEGYEKATYEQELWLRECIKMGKYVHLKNLQHMKSINYVTPIPGNWYKLHNSDTEKSICDEDVWIVLYTEDKFSCPYILNNKYIGIENFNGDYKYTEAFPEDVNPYVPEEYKIKQIYEIY